jgi:hypothetical protein
MKGYACLMTGMCTAVYSVEVVQCVSGNVCVSCIRVKKHSPVVRGMAASTTFDNSTSPCVVGWRMFAPCHVC